jgi:hypothetical protein
VPKKGDRELYAAGETQKQLKTMLKIVKIIIVYYQYSDITRESENFEKCIAHCKSILRDN